MSTKEKEIQRFLKDMNLTECLSNADESHIGSRVGNKPGQYYRFNGMIFYSLNRDEFINTYKSF